MVSWVLGSACLVESYVACKDYNAAQEEINGRKLLDDEASDPRAIDHQARDDGWSLARAATKLASMRSMQAQCRETLASPIM